MTLDRRVATRITSMFPGDDSGLSLVEVVVAIFIIAAVATSSATLCLTGLAAAATQERRQIAVTIASGTMETVSAQSVATNATTGVSSLFTGRMASLVSSAWTANGSLAGVAQTYAASDPTATALSTPVLPLTTTVTQVGTTYTVTTLLGTCYQPKAGGDCSVLTGNLTPPSNVPSGYTQMIRAIIVVKWTAGSSCAASGCLYSTSSLIDPNTDLEWIAHV